MKKLLAFIGFSLVRCDDATMLVVDNAYADSTIVDAVWWSETYVPDAVPAGQASPAYRSVPGSAVAYVVLERDGHVFVAETAKPVSVERSSTLHITISPDTIIGDCASSTLTQAQADFITESIFPTRFEGTIYDAATCKLFTP